VRFSRVQKWYQSIGLHITLNRWHFLLKFKENLLFKLQETCFSGLSQILWLIIIHWAPVAFTLMADNFPTSSAGKWFCNLQRQWACRYWLIEKIDIPLLFHLNCSRRLIPAICSVAESLFLVSADWLSAFIYLQRVPHWNGLATYFGLSRWNWFFAI
jgi:hypothetical protein